MGNDWWGTTGGERLVGDDWRRRLEGDDWRGTAGGGRLVGDDHPVSYAATPQRPTEGRAEGESAAR